MSEDEIMPVQLFPNSEKQGEEISVMHRPRLYRELDEHLRCPLIGIICDSGFGKTALLQGYLSCKGIKALWCDFGDGDTCDEDIRQTYDLIQANTDFDVIVFERCEAAADDPKFSEAVTDLLKTFTDCTIILSGTTLPNLPYAVMRAKEQYFELTYEDLMLDRSETESYFNDYLEMNLRDYELDFIAEQTHGWFTSNQLIYTYLRKNHLNNLDSLDLNFLSDITDINDYFSYNLYENQTPEMQDFMLRISPLTELDPAIINLYLQIENADQYIAELEQHHGFIYLGNDKTLRLHPLLRQFLFERYNQLHHNDYLTAHQRLAEIYEQKRQYVKAFAHAVACNDYVTAIRLMSRISDRYNAVQLMNIIDGHLEEISPNLLFSNTSLFLMRCMPEELTIQFVQPLAEAIKVETDTLRQANLQHRLGALYYHLGNVNMSFELLEKSLTNAELLRNAEVMAFNYQLLADCHMTMGDIDQALRCARNALYLSEQNDLPVLLFHTLEAFARVQLAKGNTRAAEDYIAQALELARPDDYELFWLHAVESMLAVANGDAELAIQCAEKSAAIVKDSLCGYDIAYTNLILAQALTFANRPDEAKNRLAFALDKAPLCDLLRFEILSELLKLETSDENIVAIRTEQLEIIERNNYHWITVESASDEPEKSADTKAKPKSSYINIHTLGDFSITCNGIPVKLKRSASIRLLHLLIINRGHFVSKDYIIDQLFPDSKETAGKNNFNVALSVLRKSIDSAAGLHGSDTSCVIREKDRYRLNPDIVNIDAANFETAYMQLKRNASQDFYKWHDLSVLYSEPFMQDYPYETLLESERDRLSSYQKDVAVTVARIYAEQGDYDHSLTYFDQALIIDPYDEDIYYEEIEMLLDAGSPAKAQLIADKMKLHVEEELGVPCSDQLQSMFDYYYKNP